MKFSCFVDIHLPKTRVVELFNNPENLKHWQDGHQGIDHLEGEPGAVGAKSMIHYQDGKRKMKIQETIIVSNLPDEFTGLYELKEMANTMQNLFEEISSEKTRYTANIEYTRFTGFMPKLLAFLMPGMFKRQVQKWMNQFKAFAENQGPA